MTIHNLNEWITNILWHNSEKPFNNSLSSKTTRQPKGKPVIMNANKLAVPLAEKRNNIANPRSLYGCPIFFFGDSRRI
jgi:hypothetical protein